MTNDEIFLAGRMEEKKEKGFFVRALRDHPYPRCTRGAADKGREETGGIREGERARTGF